MPARTLEQLGIAKLPHLALHLGISERHLQHLMKPTTRLYFPHQFTDKKLKVRNGFVPTADFRPIADRIKEVVQRIEMPPWLQGGIPGRSAIKNAIPHIGKPFVYNLDLRSFYPSIHPKLVYRAFSDIAGCTPDVARCLTRLATCEFQLPQGSPPSAFIAAMVSIPMSYRLRDMARQHGAAYTQYVDDITLSGPAHLERLEGLIEHIVTTSGFILHPEKRSRLPRHVEQTVTGVRVNIHLDAPHAIYDRVIDAIEKWESGTGEHASLSSLQGSLAYIHKLCPENAAPLGRRLLQAVARADGATNNSHQYRHISP